MIIDLTEYETVAVSQEVITPFWGEYLWRRHDQQGGQLGVEEPSFRNAHQWQLTSKGWVGTIPLTADLQLHLQPKAPVANLFCMLAYAYQLQSF